MSYYLQYARCATCKKKFFFNSMRHIFKYTRRIIKLLEKFFSVIEILIKFVEKKKTINSLSLMLYTRAVFTKVKILYIYSENKSEEDHLNSAKDITAEKPRVSASQFVCWEKKDDSYTSAHKFYILMATMPFLLFFRSMRLMLLWIKFLSFFFLKKQIRKVSLLYIL